MEFYGELPWLSESQRLKLEFAVAEIESHFQRSVVWSTKSWDCDLLTRLHDGYRSLIRSLPRGFWTRLRDAIEGRIRLGVDFQELHLHYSCRHFGRCYALNQFVVLLLSEYLRRFRGMDPLIQRSRLTKISSTNCSGGPANSCHGKTHEITLVESATCSGVVSESARTLAAEVVVIRHGIDSDGRDIRQTVPLFMPWEQKANV